MKTVKSSWIAVSFVGAILVITTTLLLYWYWHVVPVKNTVKSTNTPTQAPLSAGSEQQNKVPSVIFATTPTEITADYGFNLEADGPIMVQYPGENPILYDPGKGCQKLPHPQERGPKKFWDPNDPKNGHVSFRIYGIGGESCH